MRGPPGKRSSRVIPMAMPSSRASWPKASTKGPSAGDGLGGPLLDGAAVYAVAIAPHLGEKGDVRPFLTGLPAGGQALSQVHFQRGTGARSAAMRCSGGTWDIPPFCSQYTARVPRKKSPALRPGPHRGIIKTNPCKTTRGPTMPNMKEPKLKTIYVCSQCGETSPRWMGRCPSCGSWNTMHEDVVAEAPKPGSPAAPLRPPAGGGLPA